ncbi:unnamed protein product [Blepharisma stoltei]|uniref:Uncharacterized protein n=1 Tax=Blepharisma stoltei TaxID=1481888 RepID=A0AAU9K955_9CILI|nr:unnamed protein product [Blepharisma stoltei]
MACIGCKDSIKRSILYTKDIKALCENCQKIESESDQSVPEAKKRNRDRSTWNPPPDTWKSIHRFRRYGKLISMELGNKTYDWVTRQGRGKFKLDQKLKQLHKKANNNDKVGLSKAVKLCYNRDYDLEQLNTFLRPMGYPYDALADLFQSFYDNHIKSYLK